MCWFIWLISALTSWYVIFVFSFQIGDIFSFDYLKLCFSKFKVAFPTVSARPSRLPGPQVSERAKLATAVEESTIHLNPPAILAESHLRPRRAFAMTIHRWDILGHTKTNNLQQGTQDDIKYIEASQTCPIRLSIQGQQYNNNHITDNA